MTRCVNDFSSATSQAHAAALMATDLNLWFDKHGGRTLNALWPTWKSSLYHFNGDNAICSANVDILPDVFYCKFDHFKLVYEFQYRHCAKLKPTLYLKANTYSPVHRWIELMRQIRQWIYDCKESNKIYLELELIFMNSRLLLTSMYTSHIFLEYYPLNTIRALDHFICPITKS